jgi:hypothetical protein
MSAASQHLLCGAYKSCMYPLIDPFGIRRPRGGKLGLHIPFVTDPYLQQ